MECKQSINFKKNKEFLSMALLFQILNTEYWPEIFSLSPSCLSPAMANSILPSIL